MRHDDETVTYENGKPVYIGSEFHLRDAIEGAREASARLREAVDLNFNDITVEGVDQFSHPAKVEQKYFEKFQERNEALKQRAEDSTHETKNVCARPQTPSGLDF